MDLGSGLIPSHFLLILEREGGHMAGNCGLLTDGRRRNRLLVAENRLYIVAEMIDGAIALVEICLPVEMDGLARLNRRGGLPFESFRREVHVLPVHYFDGAFVAADLLAIAVMLVAEVATVIDMKIVGVFVNGAEGIWNVAVVGLIGPAIDAAGSDA